MLYDKKKHEHLKKAEGKYVGAKSKLTNYEYGREKAKKVAMNKALQSKASGDGFRSKEHAVKKIRQQASGNPFGGEDIEGFRKALKK